MTWRGRTKRRINPNGVAPTAGLFGLLGQGNLGNDGSLEAVLTYVRAKNPDVILDVLCTGPDVVTAQHDVPAAQLRWYHAERQSAFRVIAVAQRSTDMVLGLTVDAVRIARWVRRHDVVIVPGMGVLETTVPTRTWKTPYWMFVLGASGRLFRTKVALVSIGANYIDERLMRWLIASAARLAYYRSYRDTNARDSMHQMGLDTSCDKVYPDVVFSLPTPPTNDANQGTVGIGVMDYCGNNLDRRQADEIRSSYVEKMTDFVLWLVDSGRPIRLITSDPAADAKIIKEITDSLRLRRPQLSPSQVICEPIHTIGDLMQQTALVDTVVATRYHSVLCALKLGKPTLALVYGKKSNFLMADMGLPSFCQPVKSFDVARLIEQFEQLESHSTELRQMLKENSSARKALADQQFADLSKDLFPAASDSSSSDRVPAVRMTVS